MKKKMIYAKMVVMVLALFGIGRVMCDDDSVDGAGGYFGNLLESPFRAAGNIVKTTGEETGNIGAAVVGKKRQFGRNSKSDGYSKQKKNKNKQTKHQKNADMNDDQN